MKGNKNYTVYFLAALIVTGIPMKAFGIPNKENPIVIFMVDPTDKDTLKDLGLQQKENSATTAPANASKVAATQTAVSAAATQPDKTLDQVIAEQSAIVLSEKQQRIVRKVMSDQTTFIMAMEGFAKARFDPKDDKAEPDFNAIRSKIVSLVFQAPDEKIYYERIYLINKIWLENQKDAARFSSLDRALRDEWIRLEERRRKIRTVLTTVTTIAGVGLGGFLSYQASLKIFPIVADDKGLSVIAKWAGRSTIILLGAGVGMAAGEYAGFLGSDLILRAERDYIQPIDGTEDLREILDVIDTLP